MAKLYIDGLEPVNVRFDCLWIDREHMAQDWATLQAHMTRFHPIGRRPFDGGNADGGYATMDYTDFSYGIGAPGEWNHPKLIEARRRVAEVAVKHGKFAGIPGAIENLDEFIEVKH